MIFFWPGLPPYAKFPKYLLVKIKKKCNRNYATKIRDKIFFGKYASDAFASNLLITYLGIFWRGRAYSIKDKLFSLRIFFYNVSTYNVQFLDVIFFTFLFLSIWFFSILFSICPSLELIYVGKDTGHTVW